MMKTIFMYHKKNEIIFSIVFCFAVFFILLSTPLIAGENHAHEEAENHDENHGGEHQDSQEHHDEHEDEHDHENEDDHGQDEHEASDSSSLSERAQKLAGITTAQAGPAQVAQYFLVSGRLLLNDNKTAHIRARYPGVAQRASVNLGDNIAAGAVLAVVESNENLQNYSLISPIGGTVFDKQVQVGELVDEQILFTVTDLNEIWLDLYVFPSSAAQVFAGQEVRVINADCEHAQVVRIDAVLPIVDSVTQTIRARARVKNIDQHWLPGAVVQAQVILAKHDVAVAVTPAALQTMEGKTVVFVRDENGTNYQMRAVTTGLQDSSQVEITSGLAAGEKYVSEGSFILKADIGKSTAEHVH